MARSDRSLSPPRRRRHGRRSSEANCRPVRLLDAPVRLGGGWRRSVCQSTRVREKRRTCTSSAGRPRSPSSRTSEMQMSYPTTPPPMLWTTNSKPFERSSYSRLSLAIRHSRGSLPDLSSSSTATRPRLRCRFAAQAATPGKLAAWPLSRRLMRETDRLGRGRAFRFSSAGAGSGSRMLGDRLGHGAAATRPPIRSSPVHPRSRLNKPMVGGAGVGMLVGSRCPQPQESDEPV